LPEVANILTSFPRGFFNVPSVVVAIPRGYQITSSYIFQRVFL
jgi:hypothetical protein